MDVEVTFPLNTALVSFTEWLETYTAALCRRQLSFEEALWRGGDIMGRPGEPLQRMPPRFILKPIRLAEPTPESLPRRTLTIRGVYRLERALEGEGISKVEFEAIRFQVWVLGPERLKVTAHCLFSEAIDFFAELLIAIAWLWEEARKDVIDSGFLKPLQPTVWPGLRAKWEEMIEAAQQSQMQVTTSHPDEAMKLLTPTEDTIGDKSWEKIPDHNWDRQALELWWQGHTVPEIGDRIALSEKTVRNRLSCLRTTHGEEIVPTDKQLRKMKLK